MTFLNSCCIATAGGGRTNNERYLLQLGVMCNSQVHAIYITSFIKFYLLTDCLSECAQDDDCVGGEIMQRSTIYLLYFFLYLKSLWSK